MPPRVKDGLMMTGYPISSAIRCTSSMLRANPLLGTLRPMFSMAARNSSRSSALWITSGLAPIISTPYFSRIPREASSTDTFSPVCPPRVGRMASGRSLAMIFSMISGVMGSM